MGRQKAGSSKLTGSAELPALAPRARQGAPASSRRTDAESKQSRPPPRSRDRELNPSSFQPTASTSTSSSSSAGSGASGAKESAIQVYVRCAPPASNAGAAECVTCEPTRSTELLLSPDSVSPSPSSLSLQNAPAGAATTSSDKDDAKLYTFDAVFGRSTDQSMLYADVCAPLLDKVLDGYPCTIFAYGATGTGKTYTMQGDLTPSVTGNYAPAAGLIPRVLYRLFDRLDGKDFSVKISYLELFNEELRDLNASSSNPQEPKIFDDASKKGVIVQNIEESHVLNAQQALKVLHRGAAKRQVAATRCNEQSSRSHTVFTITVSVTAQGNSTTVGSSGHAGEDSIKVGKLSLVDLAGSENIGRSGAGRADGRAREAGVINASLLTLGRVISSLVDKGSHIPYRESKLTRLLQDSLGGRTQTCIIATVASALDSYEETQSTLDYALRARSITNRPESNARLTRHGLLNSYAAEIERLRLDLAATREKNGIFLSPEHWEELNASQEKKRTDLEHSKRQIETLDMNLRTMSEQFEHSLKLLGVKESDIRRLAEEKQAAFDQIELLQSESDSLRKRLAKRSSEAAQSEQRCKEWRTWATQAIQDADGYRAKLDRKSDSASTNASTVAQAKRTISMINSQLDADLQSISDHQEAFTSKLRESFTQLADTSTESASTARQKANQHLEIIARASEERQEMHYHIESLHAYFDEELGRHHKQLLQSIQDGLDDLASHERQVRCRLQDHWRQSVDTVEGALAAIAEKASDASNAAEHLQSKRRSTSRSWASWQKNELEEENARLSEQNAHLARMLGALQTSQASFQQSFLSSVSKQLAGFSNAQSRILGDGLGSAQRELSQTASRRESSLQSQIDLHEEQDAAEAEQWRYLLESHQAIKSRRDSTSKHLQDDNHNMHQLLQASAANARTDEKWLYDEAETVSREQKDRLAFHVREIDHDNQLQSNAAERLHEHGVAGIQGLLNCLAQTNDAVSSLVDDGIPSIEEHQVEQDQLLEACSQRASDSARILLGSLHLEEDRATGQTPRKRSWPELDDDKPRKAQRYEEAATPDFSTVGPAKLAQLSPNKPSASSSTTSLASKQPSSAIQVFTDKSSALNAVIEANLDKPEKQSSKPHASQSAKPPPLPRSPLKSFR